MNTALIGLGSNIQPHANIIFAKEKIAARFSLRAESSFIKTKPIGDEDQPDFINGVVMIETDDDMPEVKSKLQEIEHELGREPGTDKWGPRIIDLDILVWKNTVVHMDVKNRAFLQDAIREILPDIGLD